MDSPATSFSRARWSTIPAPERIGSHWSCSAWTACCSRAVTPPGAFGRVFGFVTTGFNIGGVIAPPVFGYLMDSGSPRLVILGVALCALLSIPTVMITVAQRGKNS
jgi:MFS family permease